jgi:hypothetical protein
MTRAKPFALASFPQLGHDQNETTCRMRCRCLEPYRQHAAVECPSVRAVMHYRMRTRLAV